VISAAWIEAKNRSTNRGLLHWHCVVQQWSDPQTWIKIVDCSTVGHAPGGIRQSAVENEHRVVATVKCCPLCEDGQRRRMNKHDSTISGWVL